MALPLRHEAKPAPFQRTPQSDRIARIGLFSTAAVVFFLLVWGHLGLSALVFPPAATAPQQVATAGGYQVTFTANSGQITTHGPNAIAFHLRDATGHAITNATIHMQPVMTTMAMPSPAYIATSNAAGTAMLHPAFSMAGVWRLAITITTPGQPDAQTSFLVSVRWS